MKLQYLGRGRIAQMVAQSRTARTLAILSALGIIAFSAYMIWGLTTVYVRPPTGNSGPSAHYLATFLALCWELFVPYGFGLFACVLFLFEMAGLDRARLLTHPKLGMVLIVLGPLNVFTLLMKYNGPPPSVSDKLMTLLLYSAPAFLLLPRPRWWRYGPALFMFWLGAVMGIGGLAHYLFMPGEDDNRLVLFLMLSANIALMALGVYVWICDRVRQAPPANTPEIL